MIRASDSTSWVGRRGYGDFPDNTGDWTLFCRFKYNGAVAALKTAQVLFLFSGDSDFSGSYLACSSSAAATTDIDFEIFNGTTTVNSANTAIVASSQNWFALTYTASTHTVAITVNGVVVDTLTINLSAVTWTNITGLGFSVVSDGADISIAYCRAWSRILMAAELTAESTSITAASQTGLLWDNPFQASIDLTSHNNTLNQLTATGTVTTDTTDPLLSVVAGPPTNISPATATAVTTDSAYFQNVNTAGVATEVWYKVTAPSDGTVMLGVCAFGDLVTYKPSTIIYDGLTNANADIVYLDINHVPNNPSQFPLIAGDDFYFRITRNAAVAASTLQFSVLKGLNLPVPVGSIAANSDFAETPILSLLDFTTGYPIHFVYPFTPVGEGGAPLASGVTLLCINENNKPNLYDANLNLITELDLLSYDRLSSNLLDTFIIGTPPGFPAILRLVAPDGTINPTIFNLGATGVQSVGLNNNASLAYYTLVNSSNTPVRTWNLLTNSAGSNLVAGVANYENLRDIIVLQDDTILIPRWRASDQDFLITRYNTTGGVLTTYDRTFGNRDDRIATAINDPVSFWRWTKTPDRHNIWENVDTVAGTVISTRTRDQFDGTVVNITTANNTPDRFGNSESCPFWITRVELFGTSTNPGGGIYLLTGTSTPNPRQNHDTIWVDSVAGTTQNLAIPDPTFESYLAGDE